MEVRDLSKEGKHLLSNCLFASEEILRNSGNDENNEIIPMEWKKLSIHIVSKLNHHLSLFFRTQTFIERCFMAITEMIKQFTALFDAENRNYINVDHSLLHFQVSRV